MQKLVSFLLMFFLFSGCYQSSLTMVGPATGIAQGRVASTVLSTGINYGVKEKTGKFPIEHIIKREKEKIVKKVMLIEKEVIKTSSIVKDKIISKKNDLKIKDGISKVRWVLGIKEIRTVTTEEEAFPANKPRYSYWSEQK